MDIDVGVSKLFMDCKSPDLPKNDFKITPASVRMEGGYPITTGYDCDAAEWFNNIRNSEPSIKPLSHL